LVVWLSKLHHQKAKVNFIFPLICLVDFPDINKGDKVAVDAIKLTVEVKEIYIIKGTAYYIIFFKIIQG